MQIHLSPYGQASVEPSPVNRMMADFASDFRDGLDINLGIGYVNEKTIPVACFKEAIEAVANDGVKYRQAFNYGRPARAPNLVESLRQFLALDARNRLILGPCRATSILEGLAEVIAPGIVVTSDPMYYIYSDALERKGFEVLAVPEDDEGIGLAALEGKLRALGGAVERIAFFYAVTVNNPSCTILSNKACRGPLAGAARTAGQP